MFIFPRVKFECTLCGECCRRYWIPITHIDILRISKYTGMDIKEFTALFPKEYTTEWSYPVIKLRDGEFYLVLRKNIDSSCIFNKRIDDKLICSIHPVKPYICRFYPFVYWEDKGIVKFEIYEKAYPFCPGIGYGFYNDFKVEVKSLLEIKKAKYEYQVIITHWNRLVDSNLVEGTIEEFYTYLGKVCFRELE